MKTRHLFQVCVLALYVSFCIGRNIVYAYKLDQDSTPVYLPLIQLTRPVHIFESNAISTRGGTFRVVGDVLSDSHTLRDITIEIKATSYMEEFPDVITKTVMLTETLPGQLNPFDIDTNLSSGDVMTHTAEIVKWSYVDHDLYTPLTVISISLEPSSMRDWYQAVKVHNP